MIDDRDEPAAGAPPPEIRSKLASFDILRCQSPIADLPPQLASFGSISLNSSRRVCHAHHFPEHLVSRRAAGPQSPKPTTPTAILRGFVPSCESNWLRLTQSTTLGIRRQSEIAGLPHELGSFDRPTSANWVPFAFRASDSGFPGPAARLASFGILPSSCPPRSAREHRARRTTASFHQSHLYLTVLRVSVVDVVSAKVAHLLISCFRCDVSFVYCISYN